MKEYYHNSISAHMLAFVLPIKRTIFFLEEKKVYKLYTAG